MFRGVGFLPAGGARTFTWARLSETRTRVSERRVHMTRGQGLLPAAERCRRRRLPLPFRSVLFHRRAGSLPHDQGGHVHFFECAETPLAGDIEASDRPHLVAKDLHPPRTAPTGPEQVEDPAAARDLARQLHAGRVVKALGDEPAGELVKIARLAPPQHARLP